MLPSLEEPEYIPAWKVLALAEVRAGGLCPACLGLEWVRPGDFPITHPRFGTLERCPVCTRGEIPEYLRQASGLKGWPEKATFSSYIETSTRANQLEIAKALVKRGHGWLTLWGGYGSGKTYLLAAIVNECLAAKRPAVYVTAGKLLDHLRDAYGPESIGYSAAFQLWCRCQVLAVDEADQFHVTSWAADKYRQLLDYRYNLARDEDSITVFACNPEPGGENWPSELNWLASRMRQFQVIEARGGDIRPVIGSADDEHWQDKF